MSRAPGGLRSSLNDGDSDTTVWIDYLRGTLNPHTEWLDREAGYRRLGLTDIILCEVLQGGRTDRMFNKVYGGMQRFQIFENGGIDLAVAAARNYRRLRHRGCTVHKTIDCLIATFCLKEGHSLLHRDREFDSFEQYLGLAVIHP